MIYNKKAQSEIITTVLIILLVLAAIVIVWQVVKGTVTTGTEQIAGGTDCITLGFTITKADAGWQNITVKRVAGAGDLGKIRVLINGKTVVNGTDASKLQELESIIIPTNVTGDYRLATNDKVEIAAVLKNGKTCDSADSYTVL
jgi:flagellin-like protein